MNKSAVRAGADLVRSDQDAPSVVVRLAGRVVAVRVVPISPWPRIAVRRWSMKDDDQKTSEIERAEAKRVHDHQLQISLDAGSKVIAFGTEALRAAALITGGSAAATMAFMGSLIANRNVELASWLPWSLEMFVAGLFCTCLATAASYPAQLFYGWQAIRRSPLGPIRI